MSWFTVHQQAQKHIWDPVGKAATLVAALTAARMLARQHGARTRVLDGAGVLMFDSLRMCVVCLERVRQDGQTCRTCGRQSGDTSTTQDRDRVALSRQQARDHDLVRVLPALPGPKGTRVIDGIEFDVQWNGT